MKKTIRYSVFETNSSSVHTLTFVDTSLNDTLPLNEDGNVEFWYGKFEWGYEKLDTAEERAVYCLADAKYDEERIELIKTVIMDYSGANDVIFDLDKMYIDHQSYDTANSELDSYDDYAQFIFSSGNYIIISNDIL